MATQSPIPGSNITVRDEFNKEYDNFGKIIIDGNLLTAKAPAAAPSIPNLATDYTAPVSLQDGQQSAEIKQPAQVTYNGKTSFTDTTDKGYRLGIDTDGIAKFRIGSSTTQDLYFDGTNLSVKGSLTVGSLDIPDTTTANSFHVDSLGNMWLGANVASGLANAPGSIDKTGAAVFKNVKIGGTTTQFLVNNNGLFNYGDGSDGAVTLTVNTTLTADKYYTNLTINDGVTLFPAGYRVFCNGTLTVGNGASGIISRNGNNGTNGVSGGAGGAAVADGYLKGSVAGQTGSTSTVIGVTGTTTSNSLATLNGSAGGSGGANTDGGAAPGAGGAGGTSTASNVKLIANWHLMTLLDISSTGSTVKFNTAGGAGSGGGGGNGNGTIGGQGGGSASGGGIIALYAKNIVINAGALIQANGGKGGDGDLGGGGVTGAGGGGGGGGGNGGIVLLIYNSLTNSGTIQVNGGVGGVGGLGGGGTPPGGRGVDGTIGGAGQNLQFQLSL